MARFRKKPVVIDAVQFRGGEQSYEMDQLVGGPGADMIRYPEDGTMLIRTPDGVMCAQPGDWVIRGVKGELYPCKPDIFAATYEAVDTVTPAAPLPRTREDGVPRRACLDLLTPAELALRDALTAVEQVGGDPLLTDVVVLIGQARDKLADYLERPPTTGT